MVELKMGLNASTRNWGSKYFRCKVCLRVHEIMVGGGVVVPYLCDGTERTHDRGRDRDRDMNRDRSRDKGRSGNRKSWSRSWSRGGDSSGLGRNGGTSGIYSGSSRSVVVMVIVVDGGGMY